MALVGNPPSSVSWGAEEVSQQEPHCAWTPVPATNWRSSPVTTATCSRSFASGSSVGLHIISSPAEAEAAAKEIVNSKYDRYLAEAFIEGRELTVGVVDDKSQGLIALPASEAVLLNGPKFDYEGKYLGRGTKEITPAEITEQEMQAAQKLAIDAHRSLGCYGYSRTDMILTPEGPVFLETNTLPGLTRASFVPQQLEAAGVSLLSFIERQIELAAQRSFK